MSENKIGKGTSKKEYAGTIFTAAIILVCLTLFFLSDNGRELFGKIFSADKSATVGVDDITEENAGLNYDEFLERASSLGLCHTEKHEVSEGRFCEYTLLQGESYSANLIVSDKGEGVCAFTMSLAVPNAPREKTDDETPIVRDLREAEEMEYKSLFEMLKKDYLSLIYALDIESELTYADVDTFFSYIIETAKNGERIIKTRGSFTLTAYCIDKSLNLSMLYEVGDKGTK